MGETAHEEARRLAEGARDRVRFEEEALALADQVYSVARHLSGSKEEAEDLVQETFARAFRSWRSFTPGTNLRAWLMRIMTNLNIDRGRRKQRSPDTQPLEEGDYYLYNRISDSLPDENPQEDQVLRRLSQNDAVNGALGRAPRLPRRRRARRHRRLLLPGRRADPRHPDRDGHVPAAPGPAHPEEGAGGYVWWTST